MKRLIQFFDSVRLLDAEAMMELESGKLDYDNYPVLKKFEEILEEFYLNGYRSGRHEDFGLFDMHLKNFYEDKEI